MLSETDARSLVNAYGTNVNEGRPISHLISYDHALASRFGDVQIAQGKVSDSVYGGNLTTPDDIPVRLMYRTNRISTHDQNRGAIPFKDQVLATNHAFMLDLLVKPYIGTSQFDIPGLMPTSTVIASEGLDMLDFENVMRQYMAESSTNTSLYVAWKRARDAGESQFCYAGYNFQTTELSPNCRLEKLLFTPSTKSHEHDVTTSLNQLTQEGICTEDELKALTYLSHIAFDRVAEFVREKGMVLVDTKTEHGRNRDGVIVSADELYTMDSSRFWKLDDSGEIQTRDGKPVSYSKEFARGMVKEENDQFSSEQAAEIAVRYIMGLQHLTGQEFVPDTRPREERILQSTHQILDELGI